MNKKKHGNKQITRIRAYFLKAHSVTTIAMLIVILLVDGTAHARIEAYKKQLELLNVTRELEK